MKLLKCSNEFISYRVVEEYEFIRITNEKSYHYIITSNDNKKIKVGNKLILLKEFIPKNEDKILTMKFFDGGTTIMKNFVGELNFITHEFKINSNYNGDIYSILKYFIDNKVLKINNL